MNEKLKHKIPDQPALRARLHDVMQSNLPDFLNVTDSKRAEVIGNRRYMVLAAISSALLVVELFFASLNHTSTVLGILVGCTILFLVVLLLAGRQWFNNTKTLAREMNMALVPILTNTLDQVLLYTHDSEHSNDTAALLTESSLITVPDIIPSGDDVYWVYGKSEVSVRELVIMQQGRDKEGKIDPKLSTTVFKGVFVIANLQYFHGAETYISTDGDRFGFAHRSFWSNVMEWGKVKETVLEWNDFENHLHVATSDPTAARELLTPDFMEDLYDWWTEHKLNVRIAFKGKKMYLLLPEASISIGNSTTSTKLKDIERYAWTVARPIWRSLLLVEDVER